MAHEPAFNNDLSASLDEAWRLLADAVTDRNAPFRTPTLANIGRDGGPRARTVVLRGADRAAGVLRIHTDRRSDKITEIGADGRVSVHFYDSGAKVQLRVAARATVHADDPIARDAWAGSQFAARACYRIRPGPGTPLDDPRHAAVPEPAGPDDGFEHFAVIRLAMRRMEWLYLAARGHRRALFDLTADAPSGRWLAP